IFRYRAIVHPLNKRTENFRHRPVILTIWLLSILVSSVQLYVSRAELFKYDGEWHYECVERWGSELDGQFYTLFVFGITFLLPLVILGFTYSAIACKLWKRSAPGVAHPDSERAISTAKWKVLKMMLTVVIIFAICWLPLQSFLMLYYFVPGFGSYPVDNHRRIYALSYFGCLWLANANSCVNPFVYSFMSDNFRVSPP
ncbi:hypothetical protein AAG570_006339, partial [Ranatra chinensis]